MWTVLRQHWGGLATAAATTAIWLALHFDGNVYVPLTLVPLGVLLALARHFGDSVRAPLALHALHNLLVALRAWPGAG
jgi:membrane protease YdiL (CAAX protease family)